MLDDLTDKVALVTGASRGIGKACALALAAAVVMVAKNGYLTGQTINVNGGWYMI